ncbi:hypothetical protein ABMA28_000341 [Loxostege sticticalis]|uniref:FLYWCH-type domain-containing protein n=1 Tax=Loxostege sticticalis TaxID=481309 RepID=A0ABD0TRW8_LOXSC
MEVCESELTFISRKHGTVLLYEGFQYFRHKLYKNGNVIWQCSLKNKNKCTGSVTLQNEKVIKTASHIESCVPDFAKNDVAIKLHEAHVLASTSDNTINKMYNDTLVPLQDKGYDFISKVPSLNGCKTAMYNKRNKFLGSQKYIIMPYLLGDYYNGSSRILVFISKEAKNMLTQLSEFFIDGTFASCPKPFGQLFTIHGNMGSSLSTTNIIPLVYSLLSDKKEATYFALFDIITSQIPGWKPTTIHADFETASTNAIRISALILPLLPENRIMEVWFYVASQSPDIENSDRFRQYVISQWIKDFIKVVCVYGERHRTTNFLEGWHHKLNTALSKKKTSLLKLLHFLHEDALFYQRSANKSHHRNPRSQRSK